MDKELYADSAFTFLFNNAAYAVDLYKALTGITLSPDQLQPVRLKDRLVKSRLYNDVSFLTSTNSLLVLIEHQTTENPNMAFRLLKYFVRLAGQYIQVTNQNKYGTKQLQIPKAELFVVYNGKDQMPPLPTFDLGDVQVILISN